MELGMNHHGHHRSHSSSHGTPSGKRNYKLLIDPVLHKGSNKVYRFEGVVENDPTYPPVYEARDPRKQRIWMKAETMDLPIPRFKIDSNYIGTPPPLEVTILNINDNVDDCFLTSEIVNKHQCRDIDVLQIYTHEFSRKHLGIARVVFKETEYAKKCVDRLNNTQLMGKMLQVFLDPFGKECENKVAEAVQRLKDDMRREEEAKEARKKSLPPPPDKAESQSISAKEKHSFEKNRQEESFGSKIFETTSHQSIDNKTPLPSPHVFGEHNQIMFSYPPGRSPYEHFPKQQVSPFPSYQDYRGYPPHIVQGQPWEKAVNTSQKPPEFQPQPWSSSGQYSVDLNAQSAVVHNFSDHIISVNEASLPPHESHSKPMWSSSDYHINSSDNAVDLQKSLPSSNKTHESPPGSVTQMDSPDKDEKSSLDLDTRIALLLQSKDSKIGPAFLNLGVGSDDDANNKESDSETDGNTQVVEKPHSAIPPAQSKTVEKLSSISAIFDSRDGGMGLDTLGSVGLGFRAAMPRMPSFKKYKIKAPSPPRLDEDSRDGQSDIAETSLCQTNVGASTDSEDDLVVPDKNDLSLDAKQKPKWSSDESESEEEIRQSSSLKEESSGSSVSSDDSEDEIEKLSKVNDEEPEEIKEIQRLNAELDAHLHSSMRESVKRISIATPERESRPSTPIPDVEMDHEGDFWQEENASAIQKKKKPSVKIEKKNDVKSKLEPELSNKSQHVSETDTADEKSDSDERIAKENENDITSLNGNRSSSVSSSTSQLEEEERSPVLMEHSYCLPWVSKENSKTGSPPLPSFEPPEGKPEITNAVDHDYAYSKPKLKNDVLRHSKNAELPVKKKWLSKKEQIKLSSHSVFKQRSEFEEYQVLYRFLIQGIDQEDINMLKRCYQNMLADDTQSYWLNITHWVDHPPSCILTPPKKKRRLDELPLHKTGCTRTEGIYEMGLKQKQKNRFTFHDEASHFRVDNQPQSLAILESSKTKLTQSAVNREFRSIQRRLLTVFGNETDSDLLKFNQLKFRKKALKFGKSRIHDWGLFAMEAIAADEMIIEYCGQIIRSVFEDIREEKYNEMGIGSSYLFRIDKETVIDATKCGNLARFINHSCNPNCYAKIITVENEKKIVIYSKQPISCGEEITYNYKFPIEDEKVICLCGAPQCRGTLN